MAVPKKKVARSYGRTRHSAYKQKTQKKILDKISLTTCENCGAKRQTHTACAECGYYKKREVLKKKKAEVTKIQA